VSEAIENLPIHRALIAVADKSGVVELASGLAALGVEIVSTGNTASALEAGGVPVRPVADVTGFPEMLGGRVKTLHPRIHGGILADKRRPEHLAELQEQAIEPFDLVVVNLYPFREAVASGADADEAVEQIDIGGPAMVRAAAKNFESVAVVANPARYEEVLAELREGGGVTRASRLALAREAFAHTADYDAAIAAWFGQEASPSGEMPRAIMLSFALRGDLRYGENPHQRAALYAKTGGQGPLGGAEVLQGKEMSYNNWLDAEAARGASGLFDQPVAVIVKHHNPCGVAVASTLAEAYGLALKGDPVSAFGGIVAFNREVDDATAQAMAEVFTEVVVAPEFTAGALEAFARKTNLRVLRAPIPQPGGLEVRPLDGGSLVQEADTVTERREDMKIVTTNQPSEAQWEDLLFAWKVAARVKSNAIVLASGGATVGIGAGQMNRVTSVGIAVRAAGDRAAGSVLASDAFFPFRDGLDLAAEGGITAVIQPGGSVRDEEVIASAEEHGLAMVFTGHRHFRH
jgi:phosphoribosylaminoimidazolecarboxamide formyltransferase / IMP cyclohydrolase